MAAAIDGTRKHPSDFERVSSRKWLGKEDRLNRPQTQHVTITGSGALHYGGDAVAHEMGSVLYNELFR